MLLGFTRVVDIYIIHRGDYETMILKLKPEGMRARSHQYQHHPIILYMLPSCLASGLLIIK
jgi:hypothetical protein